MINGNQNLSIHQGGTSPNLLKGMSLAIGRIDSRSYPGKNVILFTENGKRATEKFKEIEEIFGGRLN